MTQEQFATLANEGYNRIPVVRSVFADLDTPLSSYLKLAKGPYSYLFESVQGGEKWGRYSILGLPCKTVLKVFGHRIVIEVEGTVVEEHQSEDPLAFVETFKARYRVPELSDGDDLRFCGGLVGYIGYDCVRYVEPKLRHSTPEDVLQTPDILLMVSDEVLVFDNLSGVLNLIVMTNPEVDRAYEQAQYRLDALALSLQQPTPVLDGVNLLAAAQSEQQFQSHIGESAFAQSVDRIKEYILAGDAMQVVVSQRLSMACDAEPLNVYRALRTLNPSPYMYFMDLGDHHVVGSSPEILARLEAGEVTIRPIAGTRRRGHDDRHDHRGRHDLCGLCHPCRLFYGRHHRAFSCRCDCHSCTSRRSRR